MMKNVKTSKFDTRLYHVLLFHYDVKMVFSTSWLLQQTESSGHLFDARVAQVPGTYLLADPLKSSALDSVTTFT